jgi:steroid delta-isomerase-like uncharacterized protein
MSPEDMKDIVRRFVDEVQTAHKLDVMDDLLSSDFVDHMAGSGPPYLEGAKRLFATLFTAFPDLSATVDDQAVDGDRVWTRKTFRGTHLGPLMGLPPSGKPVSFEAIEILRIADGKTTEHWAVTDMLSLMQQIGALVSPVRGGG